MIPSASLFLEMALTLGLIVLALMSLHLAVLGAARLVLAPRPLPVQSLADQDLPEVLIQIPLYNEGDLIHPILDAVSALDWPADRLRIQVLDDSTDESIEASRAAVAMLRSRGVLVDLHHRSRRAGFKAGALAEGLARANAPFVAIFDADFLPPGDFLRRTLGVLLADPGLAYVQARWLHLNRERSMLTRAQGRLLDGHFLVEQEARLRLGLPVPFNGTCGVWRTQAIVDAGGWHGDTLTEDLDLSLRAHLKGWRSGYLVDLGVPGVLPESPRAWRTQQFRWTKGFVECLVKLAPAFWRSQRLMAWQKLLITLQMAQPLAFLVGSFSILAGLPFIAGTLVPGLALSGAAFVTGSIGLLGPMSLLVIGARGAPPYRILRESVIALLLTSGLILSNARAALEALLRIRSAFIRTPKRAEYRRAGRLPRLRHRGLIEVSAGGGLLTFVLLQHPVAVFPMLLVIGGLLAFGLMQLDEQSGAAIEAVPRIE